MKKNRFLPAHSPVNGAVLLIIEDFTWFSIHNEDIVNWMQANLPRGADHQDRKSTRLNSSHSQQSRMPSSA